jgi:hypothetical protein
VGQKGPWTNYTKRMLQMRARSWCLRDVYPDVLRGVPLPRRSRDIEPEKDVTPPQVAGEIETPRSKSKPAPVDAEVVKADAKPDAKVASSKAAPAPAAAAAEVKKDEQKTGDFATPASTGQLAHIRKKAETMTVTEAEIIREFKLVDGDGEPLKSLDGISVGTGNMVLQFLSDPAAYRGKPA